LALYDEKLIEKQQLVVFNKIDLPEAQAQWPELEAALKARGIPVMAISAASQQNVRDLVQKVFQLVSTLPEQEVSEVIAEKPLYEMPEDADLFKITRGDDGSYHVTGRRIERAAAMTYWDYEEAVMRFQNLLEALGISEALEKAGVKVGDTVFIGEFELEWSE